MKQKYDPDKVGIARQDRLEAWANLVMDDNELFHKNWVG